MACNIIFNKEGKSIGVKNALGQPSKVFQQISGIPHLNFQDSVEVYSYLKGEIPTLDQVTEQLQKTGLAKGVNILSPQQIEQELVKRGIDNETSGLSQLQKAQVGLLPNGFVDLKTKEVFLNQETANLDTPIHEFSHLFTNLLKQTNPSLYKKGLELVEKEGQEYIDFVKQNQPDLEGEALLEEALTQAVGEAGAKIINKQSGLFQWIQDMWDSLKDMLGLTAYSWNEVKNMNLQQFTEAMAVDLLRGEELNLDTNKAFNEGVEAVAKLANEYKKEFGIDSVQHNKVGKLFPAVSRMISEAYEQAETGMTTEEVREAYKALERETLQQYEFIVNKGLKVSRWTGEGEPYPNSKSMLKDVRENNHLYFLPNSEAFGKEGDEVEGRAGLNMTDVYLEDGYRMTLSEVFRVVHDYFGHGILGNQFGAVGEENATLQHLDLYSFEALPAVIFQTRGQNSWVNFSGANNEALRKIREGSKTNNKNLLEEGQKEFIFATPKDSILPSIFNFKTYETARRINEQEEIRKSEAYLDPRGKHEDTYISELLTRHTSRNSGKLNGFSRRSLGVSKRVGDYDVDVIAEYEGNQEVESLIKNVFPEFKGTQKIYEISNGAVYREMMIEALETNKFKASVTVHSAEDFSNMRLFVTEDGSTGITLTKDGFLGGGFGNPKADRPNNLAQMMLLGIKEGAITAEAFDTILPNYYTKFGFKAVSRTAFNHEYRPLKENGALEDWDYELYRKFNNGRPDIVFFIYDGGNRESIQSRLGQFDSYSNYQKQFTESYDKDSYDDAYRFMEVEAINKNNYQNQIESTTEEQVQTVSNPPIQFRTSDGAIYPNLKSAVKSGTSEVEVGIMNEDGEFITSVTIDTNSNPSNTIGLMNALIKDDIITGESVIDSDGSKVIITEGFSEAKKAINADVASKVSGTYHGKRVLKATSDNNVVITEQEENTYPKNIDVENTTLKELEKQVGVENAMNLITLNEFKKEGKAQDKDRAKTKPFLPENELEQKLIELLNKFGIKITSIEAWRQTYYDKNGVLPDAEALADLANNIIAFRNGEITSNELAEEVSHFIVASTEESQKENMKRNVHRTREWAEFAEQYYEIYSKMYSGEQLESAVREEILGKVLANSLKENFQRAQENTIEGGIVHRLFEAFRSFFQMINDLFKPSWQTELETYNYNVYQELMSDTLNLNTQGSSFVLFSAKGLSPLHNRLNNIYRNLRAQQKELSRKYPTSSNKNALNKVRQELDAKVDDITLKIAASNLVSVANSQVGILNDVIDKEGAFNQEEAGVFESLERQLRPMLNELRHRILDAKVDKTLIESVNEVIEKIDVVASKVPARNEAVIEKLIKRIIDRYNMYEIDAQGNRVESKRAEEYREHMAKILTEAQKDTNFLHAHFGGLLHARDGLLNLAGDIVEVQNYESHAHYNGLIKPFLNILESIGFDGTKLGNILYKGKVISHIDPELVEKLQKEDRAKVLSTLVTGVDSDNVNEKLKELQDERTALIRFTNSAEDKTTPEYLSNSKRLDEVELILTNFHNNYYKETQKYRISKMSPALLKKMNEHSIEVLGQKINRESIPVDVIDQERTYKGQIAQVRGLAEKGELTKSQKEEIKRINKQRNQMSSPRDEEGKLRNGVLEVFDPSRNAFVYKIDTRKLGERDARIARYVVGYQNLILLNKEFWQEQFQSAKTGGIPQRFVDEISEIPTAEGQLEYLLTNASINFPQSFWDSFDPSQNITNQLEQNGSDEALRIREDIREKQTVINNIIKANKQEGNPSEVDVAGMDKVEKDVVRETQTELESLIGEAKILLGEEFIQTEFAGESTPNEAYFGYLSDAGIEQNSPEEIEFILQHTSSNNSDSIRSVRRVLNKLKRGEAVTMSKILRERVAGRTDYDNILSEFARERLLPYYRKFQPEGFSSVMENLRREVDNGDTTAVSRFLTNPQVEVSPNLSFYDQIETTNPEWIKNAEEGREQWSEDYLKKVRNKEYYNRYGINDSGQATANLQEFQAREAYLDLMRGIHRLLGIEGEGDIYLPPQMLKSVLRRITTMKGNLSGVKEIILDMTTIREDDMEYGQGADGSLDGRSSIPVIPMYGVSKVENQEDVTDELLLSISWMAQQAALHKSRKDNINDMLAIKDFLLEEGRYVGKSAEASNAFKMFESALNHNFYGIKETFKWEVNMPFTDKKLNVAKLARMFNSWVRFSNLAGVTVPLTSLVQGKINELVESAVGETINKTAFKLGQRKFSKYASGMASEVLKFGAKSEGNVILEAIGIYNPVERMYDSGYSKTVRGVLRAPNSTHQMANFPVIPTTAFSVLEDYRFYEGRIITMEQWKKENKGGKSNAWEKLPLFSKILSAKDGLIDYDYAEVASQLGVSEEVAKERTIATMGAISLRAKSAIQRVDTMIPQHQKSIVARHALGEFFLMHMNWFIVGMQTRFKNKHFQHSEGNFQEGYWITILTTLRDSITKPKEAKKLWQDMWNDEVGRKNLHRFLIDQAVAQGLAISAILLANMNDDDDETPFLLAWSDYMLTRIAVEQVSGTVALPAQFDEIISNPIVGLQRLKDLPGAVKVITGDDVIQKGNFAGKTEREKWMTQNLPILRDVARFRDFEQARDTYSYFNLERKGLFKNWAFLSRLAEEEEEE